MTQISIPTINFGKRKQRSQMVLLVTVYRQGIKLELPIGPYVMLDDERVSGYTLAPREQMRGPDGHWYQIVYESNTTPVAAMTGGNIQKTSKDEVDSIYNKTYEETHIELYRKARKSDHMNKIMWMIVIPSVCIMLIFAMQKFF